VRTVTDVPFTAAVAVLMRLPELLAVGVFPPPPPYLPPYPLPLVVGVVPPVEEAVPVPLVVLPQAVKRTMHVTKTRILNQPRILACVVKRLLRITFSSFTCGDICNENESCNDLLVYTYWSYKAQSMSPLSLLAFCFAFV
jgi:hypothetical protein